MRTARIIAGLALMFAAAWHVQAQVAPPTPAVVALPEVEVRSGPSPKFYATGKLRQGDRVQVVKDEEGWLGITPPPGSFSWINGRLVERMGNIAVVRGEKVPVMIGSSLSNQKPTVQQITLQRGTQVVILGEPLVDDEGKWWPIQPHASEVRYIPKEAVKTGGVEMVLTNRPADSAAPSAPAPPPPPAPAPAGTPVSNEPLWLQAQQMEQAGNVAEAIRLYEQLSRQTSDHNLSLAASNRAQFLRDGNRGSAPAGYQPRPNEATYGRIAPVPAGTTTGYQPNYQRTTSHYTYVKESAAPRAGYTPATPVGPQRTGPGRLIKTGMLIDGKQAFRLEFTGRPFMYVTGAAGVNLEPYVNRVVDLAGPMVYRGDLRTNYMSASQVNFIQ